MRLRSKENHFKYRDVRGQFALSYGTCRRRPGSFRVEAIRAAKEIRKSFGKKDLYVAMSGGIDSEMVASAFLAAKIPFTAVILKMADDKNAHDWQWAEKWCRRHAVPIQFFHIDVLQFVRSKSYLEVARLAGSANFVLHPTMKLMEFVAGLGGVVILGSGDCKLEVREGRWQICDYRNYMGFYRFADALDFDAVPSFFRWSPALMASSLLDPLVQTHIFDPSPKDGDGTWFKYDFYNRHFPMGGARTKFHGHEKLEALKMRLRPKLRKMFPEDRQEISVPYGQMLKDLLGDAF